MPAAVAPKETITHHFFVSGIGQKKTVDAAKICGGAENVVKTETQQTFVNGLLGFITLGIYTLRWKRVCIAHDGLYELPIDMGNLICNSLINILLGSSSCFCIVISLCARNNPVQRCLPVGGSLLSTPEAVVGFHALTDRLLWCAATDDQRQHHHAEHHFQL